MIVVTHTTRDHVWINLPIWLLVESYLLFITLATFTRLLPAWRKLTTDEVTKTIFLIIVTIYLTICLCRYIFRLIWPISYRTIVFPDRVVLQMSNKPQDDLVLERSNVKRFFSQRRCWYQHDKTILSVMYETYDNKLQKIGRKFLSSKCSRPFYAAIARHWGLEYVTTFEGKRIWSS